MKIIIDGYEDLVIAEENETLEELLIQLEEWIKENKRVIVETKLEGKSLSEEDKKILFHRKVSQFEILELSTVNLWQWAIDSLEKIKISLPELARQMEKVSFLIQQGNYKSAFSLLDRYIGLWDQINQTLAEIEKIFALDYTQTLLKEEKTSYEMKQMVQFLKRAKKAIEDNDFLALADVLEYELAPRIREEKRAIEEMINMVKYQIN